MIRTLAVSMVVGAALATGGDVAQTRGVRELTAQLSASDPAARARASCELRDLGDGAFDALQPLIGLLADAAPVEPTVCGTGSWRNNGTDLTSPGELAAGALVAIGSRVFQPVLAALRSPAWVARRNAAWALGALDDHRAVAGLTDTLKDREAGVRSQAAWALGAIDDPGPVPALIAALKDSDAGVRQQTAWALGRSTTSERSHRCRPRSRTMTGALENRRRGRSAPSMIREQCRLSLPRSRIPTPMSVIKPRGPWVR